MDCARCRIHTRSSFLMQKVEIINYDSLKKDDPLLIKAKKQIKELLRMEEINHPETVYQRAFIPGWDD